MSKRSGLMVLCFITLCSQYLHAQARLMGIEEMFSLADRNSKSIQGYRTGREAAVEAVKAAKAQRFPDIDATVSASYLGNGRLWDRDFANGMKIDIPHFGNNFALEAQQVIYAGGAIDSNIEMAELNKQLADLDLEKNNQDIRFLLIGYYLNLYKQKNQILVLQKNLELTEQIIENMKARNEQGTVLENDITRYELQKETLKLQIVQVEDACKVINHRLVTLLHLSEDTVILPDSTLLDRHISVLEKKEWQEIAAQHNIDLQQAQLEIEINRQRVRMEKSKRLPKIALVAAEHLDGPITIEVPVLDNNFNYWYVGVGVSYSLSSLFKEHRNLKQSKLNVRRAEENYDLAKEQVGNAVQECYVNFQTAFTDLHVQEKSVKLANENYSVTNNRYENGLAILTEMLDASTTKLNAELGLVNARINILYNYYKMQYVTHTL